MGDADNGAASWGQMNALLPSQSERYHRSSHLSEDGSGKATVPQGASSRGIPGTLHEVRWPGLATDRVNFVLLLPRLQLPTTVISMS